MVHVCGLVALVEEVVHLAGAEFGAFAEPVGGGGLKGGLGVAEGGALDVVIAALGVGETEPGELKAGVGEVRHAVEGRALGVGDDLLVGGDGVETLALVFEEVGDFEAEEEVVGVLGGEAALDDEGFGVAGLVAEEDGEDGAGFDGCDDAVIDGLTELIETLLLVSADAHEADDEPDPAREAGDGELLDADGHAGVGVLRIDLEGGFGVVAGGVALMGGGGEGVVYKGDEGGVHAFGIAAGEVGVGVVGIGLEGGVGEVGDFDEEGFDAVADGLGNIDLALGGEEAVVGVVGGVEEVLMVELAEDEGGEDVVPGHGIGGMLGGNLLLDFERGVVVEVVEVQHGLADLGIEVEGIGVEVGLCGREGGEGEEEEGEERGAGERQEMGPRRTVQAVIPPDCDWRRANAGPTQIDYTHGMNGGGMEIQLVLALTVLTVGCVAYMFWPQGRVMAPVEKTRLDYLRERKDVVYENLRDLNFEFRAGKYPEDDYARQRASLEDEAAKVMMEMESLGG